MLPLLSVSLLCAFSLLSKTRATSLEQRAPQKGFAKANGSLFEVDGKPFVSSIEMLTCYKSH